MTPEEDTRKKIPLSPPGRGKRIFVNSLISHILVFIVPLLWVMLMDQFNPPEETFSVNVVDEPSVGPVTGPVTTRLPPSEKPTPEAEPDPTPAPEPTPDLPTPEPTPALPEPAPPSLPEPTIKTPFPVPQPPKRKEPKLSLPTPPRPPTPKPVKAKNTNASSDNSRRLTNNKKKGGRTGSNFNDQVPIGKADVAQKFGEKFSNTPQGGPDRASRYSALLATFLKTQWQAFVPSRADLGDSRPTVLVSISIAGNGTVLEARIVRSSGVAAMDIAARRMLDSLKRVPAPLDGKPWKHDNIELDTENN